MNYRGLRRNLLIPLVVLGLLAAGCNQPQRQEPPPKKPVRGGTLVVGVDRLPPRLNPALTASSTSIRVLRLLNQGLVSLDEDLTPQPELAERFTVDTSGTSYTFHLRDGVKWHDGVPLTSADVKFSFETLLLEYHSRTGPALKPKLKAIEIPDEKTVVFRLNEPFSAFMQLMTVADGAIVPKHALEGAPDPLKNPANDKAIGTGPFRLVSFTPKSELRLERNPDYFRNGFPYLDGIVIREIPDPAALLQALESGEIDLALDAPPGPDLRRLRSSPEFRVVSTNQDPISSNCTHPAGFNLDRPMFRDVRVRRAIAHGTNGKRMVDEILFGFGRASKSAIASGMEWAHLPDSGYPKYDRAKADKLLTEAGWVKGSDGVRVAKNVTGIPDSTSMKLEIMVSASDAKLAEVMRDELGQLGITVAVIGVETNLLQARVYEERNFDIYITTACQRTDPDIGLRRTIHSSAILPVPATNGAGYRSKEVDDFMDKAAIESERTKRAALYKRVQETLSSEMPYLWLVEFDTVSAHTRKCGGIRFESVDLLERAYCAR